MIELMFLLDTIRCSNLLNSTDFFEPSALGRLVYSCSLSCLS
jgi:hypothetical protein